MRRVFNYSTAESAFGIRAVVDAVSVFVEKIVPRTDTMKGN